MARAGRITNTGAKLPLATAWTRVHAWLYRRTGGRFIPRWFGGPVMVLETVGRKSGRPRATPVIYLRDGRDLVVVAANAGSHRTPAWWLNLRAAGSGEVVIGGQRHRVRPRLAEPAERERLWPRLVELYPPNEDYVRFTDRELPVVILEPIRREPA
jgi:deazaflavin-dependent oxidoreductase (nitroreductase family)